MDDGGRAAIGSSVWLGLFAFKHVDYSNDLWWQFELRSEASRMLRASVGAAITVLLFACARLLVTLRTTRKSHRMPISPRRPP
jgi:phosphatidylglycerol lysyltransferase